MGYSKFSHLGNAKACALRCIKPHLVIMGDDGLFWVVTLSEAARMVKGGYEVAE